MDTEGMVDAVRDYIDKKGWHYEYNAEKKFMKLGFNIKSKLKNVRIFWEFKRDSYLVYTIAPICADKDNLAEVHKYVNLVNYCLINGNFELDVRDGELRYKAFVNTEGLDSISEAIIDDSLDVGIYMMEHYGDGFAALAMGFSDAETEYKKTQDNDN